MRGPLILGALLVVSSAACSASNDAFEVGTGEVAVSNTTPVTYDHFEDHPTIKAIEADVNAIEAAHFVPVVRGSSHETCGSKLAMSIDGASRVRKFVVVRAGFGTTTTTYYFNQHGEPQLVSRIDVVPPSSLFGGTPGTISERRVYFYEEASSSESHEPKVHWLDVSRSVTSTDPQDVTTAPFARTAGLLGHCDLPSTVDLRIMLDPAKFFDGGCIDPAPPVSVLTIAACAPG